MATNPDPPTGRIQRLSLIYQAFALVTAIGIFVWSINATLGAVDKSNKLLETAQKTLDAQTRPLVDTMTMQKCRDIVCNTSPDGEANKVKIRAIEAGGFYTVVADYRIFPQAIANMTDSLNMTIEVDNPVQGHEQKIAVTYKVDIGG